MNKYVKEFLHRGLMFGGFGPIVLGIIYYIISLTSPGFSLSGGEILLGIISIYVLAFVQAGATIFNQIEHWSTMKGLLWHFSFLYIAYLLCYLLNSWIPFKIEIAAIFTLIFVAVYLIVWLIVYFSVKGVSRKFNANL